MSLATIVKEFAEILNDIYTTKDFTGDFPKAALLQPICIYAVKVIGSVLFYLLSFQWLRDLSFLPLLAPEMSPSSLLGNDLLEVPSSHIFSFSGTPKYATDQLLAGFVNSFFFSLPISLPHLVSIRRLFYQGTAAAAASVIGTIVAHSIFLIGVIYGLRFLIIPWFSLAPLNYIVGVFTIATIVSSMAQQKGIKIVNIRNISSLAQIFVLNFILTWCEEVTIFHSLSNLTLNPQISYLDLYPSSNALYSFLIHTTYLLAFVVGNCIFSILFYYLILKGGEYVRLYTGFDFRDISQTFNRLTIFLIVAFTLSSFPYYGLDYLFTKMGGFLPEDPAYSKTVFSPTVLKTKFPHFFKEIHPNKRDEKTPLNLDLNYFDRGLYLNAPKDAKAPLPIVEPPVLTFEELNYQGEYAWVMRSESAKELSKRRTSLFTPLFRRSRRHYIQLRADADERRALEERRARQKIPLGKSSEWPDGKLPGEKGSLFIKIPNFLGRTFILPREVQLDMREFQTPGSSSFSEEDQSSEDTSEENAVPKKMIQVTPGAKKKKVDPLQEELNFEYDVNSNFSKGFAPPFSVGYDRMRSRFLLVKNVIKRKYFLNPVYKSLIQTDIDAFLARQPTAYKLASNQEFSLYEKRKMLEKYYNWLRYYEPFEKMIQLRYEIPDSKSFVDRIYHQQFKGTLKIARRLFKVTFDSEQNPDKKRILSYDQILYKDAHSDKNPILHEELLNGLKSDQDEIIDFSEKLKLEEKSGKIKANSFVKDFDPEFSPFIEESASSPIYAGWDEGLRRFVVTNRFLITQEK